MTARGLVRGTVIATAVLAASLWFAPRANAGVHVGVGISVPGVNVGVGNCWRCVHPVPRRVHYPRVYPAPVYVPTYYRVPVYYPAPVYYPRPVHYRGYHGRYRAHHYNPYHYRHGHWQRQGWHRHGHGH